MALENAGSIALSRQVALRQQMDTIANNIANANTTGYKAQNILFSEHLANAGRSGELSYVSHADEYRDMTEGAFTATDGPLDVAVKGQGFLVVESPDEQRFYTRNGRMTMNNQGLLVNADGYKVMGDRGQITIPEDAQEIEITPDGTISYTRTGADGASLNQETTVGRLQLVDFDDVQSLRRAGNSLYTAPAGGLKVATDALVAQGMIEQSNVSPILEMSKMIATHQAYRGTQKALDIDHGLQMSAIDKLARVA
ncbi:MAG: flagellar basal-body rod protein FlgF [Rhodospirillaceae bacterium]|jgi:flagellar basal-body rod protein FlgF|nr:flagellar basal-body rod protein FlgF [Rhodospirillaceae bacterium]MBT5374967.1 flagellar basal-body rod protein FlgF [Rhodospirillaceae bacterium]MBT5659093.1 flagellar basal-body rod protein FlgF [Rhodospirillaceae bacterium]MBT5751740.1 flagellar basal-body rod protein FlgF [Rhodospirillaceae bacterium]